jgi:hypothetical protein
MCYFYYIFISVANDLTLTLATGVAFKFTSLPDMLALNVARFAVPVNVTAYVAIVAVVPLCTQMTSAD